MGMSSANVQQSMQQGGGKGGPLGQAGQAPTPQPQFDATSYLAQNPDVAQSFSKNDYGMNQEQFAQTHFQKYGMSEGRMGGNMPSPTAPTGGKGVQQIQGMQGVSTNSATSGQPTMGTQNQYPNTVGQWDNTQIKPVQQQGKGKGA